VNKKKKGAGFTNRHAGKVVKPPVPWQNKDVDPINKIKCIVPEHIQNVMCKIDKQFSDDEFSIFCKGKYIKEDKNIIIDEAFFIPKQEVSPAAVDYNEDAPEGYNCVIHKHPKNMKVFSSTDDDYINRNFDISLLWVNSKFETGQVRVKTEYGYIIVKTDIEVQGTDVDIPEEELNKITSPIVTYNDNYNLHGVNNKFSGNFPYLNQKKISPDFGEEEEKEEDKTLESMARREPKIHEMTEEEWLNHLDYNYGDQ